MSFVNKGDLVTTIFKDVDGVSNTCEVDHVTSEYAYLTHPLAPNILIKRPLRELNIMLASGKCSTERSLDFCKSKKTQLDFNTQNDLETLCMSFVVKRYLTPRQKHVLANILGQIAANTHENKIETSINFIKTNEAALDDFNRLWYNNFKRLFDGTQQITSKKQRSAIFNMAGFIMSELNNPKIQITNEE